MHINRQQGWGIWNTVSRYSNALKNVIQNFRSALSGWTGRVIPFVMGTISNTSTVGGIGSYMVNSTMTSVSQSVDKTAVADVGALPLGPDNLHYTAASQREMGKRYYNALKTLIQAPVQQRVYQYNPWYAAY